MEKIISKETLYNVVGGLGLAIVAVVISYLIVSSRFTVSPSPASEVRLPPVPFSVQTLETDQFRCAIVERSTVIDYIQCFPKEK